jgi:hypothetical protein
MGCKILRATKDDRAHLGVRVDWYLLQQGVHRDPLLQAGAVHQAVGPALQYSHEIFPFKEIVTRNILNILKELFSINQTFPFFKILLFL